MSFNISTRINNLYQLILDVSNSIIPPSGFVTNPLSSNLDVNNYDLTNLGNLSGTNIKVNASTVALGDTAGSVGQQFGSIALGINAGKNNQQADSISIGDGAGTYNQQNQSIAIGFLSGNQGQQANSIAIGSYAGTDSQNSGSVAIGAGSGQSNQGLYSVAMGLNSGNKTQGNFAIAIGGAAGQGSQKDSAIAIGCNAGQTLQGTNSIALGTAAGKNNQQNSCIAIGAQAGELDQSNNAISIGNQAGNINQGDGTIAIGYQSACNNQKNYAISIGQQAGITSQGTNSIAIGLGTANFNQGMNSVAIGSSAAQSIQGQQAVAIGYGAGNQNQGDYSIAIGSLAGFSTQYNNSIILNASGSALNGTTQTACYISPIRNENSLTTAELSSIFNDNMLRYNTSTKETLSDIYDWYQMNFLTTQLTNTTALQSIFNKPSLNNLPAGTYEGQIIFRLTNMSTLNKIPNFRLNLSGAPLYSMVYTSAYYLNNVSILTGSANSQGDINNIGQANQTLALTGAGTYTQLRCKVDFYFYIDNTYTLTPQISFLTGACGTPDVDANSFIRLRRIGGTIVRPPAGWWS